MKNVALTPHQFGAPEIFFPGPPGLVVLSIAGADPRILKKGEGAPKLRTIRFSAPVGTGEYEGCGDKGCLRGMCPPEVEKK